MRALILALSLLPARIAAQDANLLEPVPCDPADEFLIPDPFAENVLTFANGDVTVARIDRGEPEAASQFLMILSPPLDAAGDKQCKVIGRAPGEGWAAIWLQDLEAVYDPDRGLIFMLPATYVDLEAGFQNAMQLGIVLRQDTGAITATETPRAG